MMGDIADDIISGFMCSWCGQCFEDEHGYPVVCDACGSGVSNTELKKAGLQRATKPEL